MAPDPRFLTAASFAGLVLVVAAASPAWSAEGPGGSEIQLLGTRVGATQSAATIAPGAPSVVLMTVTVGNEGLLGTRTLQMLRLTNTTVGPGTLAQRDAELGTCRLYLDEGSGTFGPGDVLLGSAAASAGKITFGSLAVGVNAGATARLFVVTDIPLGVRDGDALDVAIQSSADVLVSNYGSWENTFPLAPAGAFIVDGMVAAQIASGSLPAADVIAGTSDALVLDVRVPANGYAADLLQQLTLLQTGTAVHGADFLSLEAWVDDGDGVFEPAGDRSLGLAGFTGGNRWQMTSLSETVPVTGLRLFFSADVPNTATDGRTLQFSIPAPPEQGVGMASGNDGPLDAAVTGMARRISTSNRVTATASPLPATVVRPDARNVALLQLTLQNRYGVAQSFGQLVVDNAGVGGTTEDRDRTVQSLTLRTDGDGDGVLGDSLVDPPVATSFFTVGRATFSGFTIAIPANGTWRGFVTANVAPAFATDGDTLSAVIASSDGLGFPDTTRVVAAWPIDSRARAGLDGMIAAQIARNALPGLTLAPSDSNVVALDVVVPRNGRADDRLTQVQIANLGTADPTDVAAIRLWRDGGDGTFSPGSDADLGGLAWNGTRWVSGALNEPLASAGMRMYAVVRLTAGARDGATLQLAIPPGGLSVASGNDGPLDQAVAQPAPLVLSNSPLLAAIAIAPEASTIGQNVSAAMVVRNAGSAVLTDVTPGVLVASGGGALTPLSGPVPASVDLAPGASDTIRWTLQAAGAGDVRLSGDAQGTETPGGMLRASRVATSNLHQVFAAAGDLDARLTGALPATVARGQTSVPALTFRLTHPGSAGSAPLRVAALRIALEDEGGAPVVPSQLLARIAVMDGATERLSRTTLESSGSEVDLTLASPVTLGAGESLDLGVTLDVLANTTVTAFRARVADSTWIAAADAYSGAPAAARLVAGAFPFRTGVAQLVEEADHLDVVAVATPPRTAGPGQAGVPMLALRLTSPGAGGITSDVRVNALAIEIADTNGSALPLLSDVVEAIQVRSALQTHTARAVSWTDGGRVTLALNPVVTVPVNTPVDLLISGDLAAPVTPGAYRLQLADSTRLDARDANTRRRVAPMLASDPLPGGVIQVQSQAETLGVRGTPAFPATVRAGDTGVAAITIVLRHPGPEGAAAIRLDSLVVTSRDEARRPVAPASVLDDLRVTWDGAAAGVATDPPASGENTAIALGARTIAAGDSATLVLTTDLAATAPEGYLELSIAAEGVRAADANLGARVAVTPDAGELPLFSGLTRVLAPARTLIAALESRMPAALAADGRSVAAARLLLANPAGAGAGAITVDHLTLRASDAGFASAAIGAFAASAEAQVNGAPWASVAASAGDTTLTLAGPAISIVPGASAAIDLAFVPRSGRSEGAVRIGIDAAGVGVVQPASALLRVQVQPEAGRAFPLWSEPGSFGALDLRASYSNFPNPFAAGREATSFAYYLPASARVWLTVYTLGGETVRSIADGVVRGAGVHQVDRWDGQNGAGRTVRNGVYVAELRVRYDGGAEVRALRKVAVVR